MLFSGSVHMTSLSLNNFLNRSASHDHFLTEALGSISSMSCHVSKKLAGCESRWVYNK